MEGGPPDVSSADVAKHDTGHSDRDGSADGPTGDSTILEPSSDAARDGAVLDAAVHDALCKREAGPVVGGCCNAEINCGPPGTLCCIEYSCTGCTK
jgi:hypothetical protein